MVSKEGGSASPGAEPRGKGVGRRPSRVGLGWHVSYIVIHILNF